MAHSLMNPLSSEDYERINKEVLIPRRKATIRALHNLLKELGKDDQLTDDEVECILRYDRWYHEK